MLLILLLPRLWGLTGVLVSQPGADLLTGLICLPLLLTAFSKYVQCRRLRSYSGKKTIAIR